MARQPREQPALMNELRHLLRQRLLVPVDGAPPKLASYSGRGPLGQWVRLLRLVRSQFDVSLSQLMAD